MGFSDQSIFREITSLVAGALPHPFLWVAEHLIGLLDGVERTSTLLHILGILICGECGGSRRRNCISDIGWYRKFHNTLWGHLNEGVTCYYMPNEAKVIGEMQPRRLSETITCAARDVIWRTVQVESSNFLQIRRLFTKTSTEGLVKVHVAACNTPPKSLVENRK